MGNRSNQSRPQVNPAQRLQAQMKSTQERRLRAMNVGNINEVIWPYWFTLTSGDIPAGASNQQSVLVTQEASFIWRYWMISVYEPGTDGALVLSPPSSIPNYLMVSFQDAQSSRVFSETQIPLNQYNNNFPYYLSTPLLFLPNAMIRANFSYTGGQAASYRPVVTLFGYRLRIQGSENINSLVTGM